MTTGTAKTFFSENDHFAQHCGIELEEVGPGTARAQMPIQPFHLNGHDFVHGAAMFTLADLVFAAASNAHGQAAVGINVSISYMKAVSSGTLYAQARELSCSAKISTYTIDVTDDQGDLVAVFQGMAYRKKEKIDFAQGTIQQRNNK